MKLPSKPHNDLCIDISKASDATKTNFFNHVYKNGYSWASISTVQPALTIVKDRDLIYLRNSTYITVGTMPNTAPVLCHINDLTYPNSINLGV